MNLEETRLSRPVHLRGSVSLGGRARGKLCRPCAALFDSLFGGGSIDPPGIDPDFSQWLEDEGLPAQKKVPIVLILLDVLAHSQIRAQFVKRSA